MATAAKLASSGKSNDLVIKICDELESVYPELEAHGQTPSVMKRMQALEFDLLVYSRLLPVRIHDIYPERKLKKILSVLDEYDNFSLLFADTFMFYLSGDVLKLPELMRRKLAID